MTHFTARTTRQFSKALGQLYAAQSLDTLRQEVHQSVLALFPELSGGEHKAWVRELYENVAHGNGRTGERPFLFGLLRGHVARCRNRLAGHPSSPLQKAKAISNGSSVLTPRECEVLMRAGFGETDTEIGRVLGISPKTVSKHVEHILQKLGVETRTAAVVSMLAPGPRQP